MTGRHFQRCLVPGKGIAPDETTIAETFRAGGYRTGFFGKWHLGGFDDWDPLSQGFDEFLGHLVGAIDNYSHYNYWGGAPRHALWKKRQPYREDGVFFPDILARECGQFVERNRSRPFFLCASFNMPHYPLQPEKRFVDENLSLSSANRRAYAATVQSMDDKIGQILDAVDQASLTEKTIVIFLSDHGHSEEKAAGSGGGWSGPHRGHKGTLWEGGIRVPCIASWPARFPAGKIRQQISSGLDWFPTLCQLCGIQAGTVDGKNLTGVLIDDAPSPHQALHWMLGSYWAVRQGRWKLSATPEGVHLSDLFEDSGEQRNVAKVYPDQLRRMRESHSQWLTEGIKPIYNVSYQ